MRSDELRAFLAGLRGRFADFPAGAAADALVAHIEAEYRGQALSFGEVLAVLNGLAGRAGSAVAADAEATLRRRVASLEAELGRRDAEHARLHRELVDARNRQDGEGTNDCAKLKSLVRALVHATRLLARDRRELSGRVRAPAGLSPADAAAQVAREAELVDAYQRIVESAAGADGGNADSFVCAAPLCSNSTPLRLAAYTLAVWLLGALCCVLAGEALGLLAFLSLPPLRPAVY